MTCIVCNNNKAPYKCPNCYKVYCSLDCYKVHKDGKCEKPPEEPSSSAQNGETPKYEYSTRQTVPIEKLRLLETDKAVRETLKNQHVRTILNTIDSTEDPREILEKAMQEPIFVEFVDACLKLVQDEEQYGDN